MKEEKIGESTQEKIDMYDKLLLYSYRFRHKI